MIIRENHKRDFIREYLSFLQVEKCLAKNSVESYERDLAKLRVWAEKNNFDLINLTRQDLREWLIDLAGKQLSDNSKRRLISALPEIRRKSAVLKVGKASVATAAM